MITQILQYLLSWLQNQLCKGTYSIYLEQQLLISWYFLHVGSSNNTPSNHHTTIVTVWVNLWVTYQVNTMPKVKDSALDVHHYILVWHLMVQTHNLMLDLWNHPKSQLKLHKEAMHSCSNLAIFSKPPHMLWTNSYKQTKNTINVGRH